MVLNILQFKPFINDFAIKAQILMYNDLNQKYD